MLAKILYRIWFGDEIYQTQIQRQEKGFSQSKASPVELLIGDEALIKKNQFYKTIDLGKLWYEMTGLPFVYALWQSKGLRLNGAKRLLVEAGELAEAKMKVEPATYFPSSLPSDDKGKKINLSEYWKHIYYRVGSNEIKGLLTFLSLTRCLLPKEKDHQILLNLSRWQQSAANGENVFS